MSTMVEPTALSRPEAATYLGLKASTLALYAAEDRGPPFIKLSPARSGRVRYLRSDLDAWLAAGAPTRRRGARPPQSPAGGFSKPTGSAIRGEDGRFRTGRHPGE
jgi:predicted DNA-binding transcriptional regulator AlpA